jgi:predicted nucleotidyltransferase
MERYLRMLGQEIGEQGMTAELAIAGGAVMLLVVQSRTVTKDIDAYFGGDPAVIREAARRVAEREGLPPDWINDAVQGFFFTSPPQIFWAEYPGLKVYAVRPDYVFAMKAIAGRPQDLEDLRDLRRYLGLGTIDDAWALVMRYVPSSRIPPGTRYLLEDLWDASQGPEGGGL